MLNGNNSEKNRSNKETILLFQIVFVLKFSVGETIREIQLYNVAFD